MVKKKNKKKVVKSKSVKDQQLGKKKETAREKMIGQSIGYRYDVNLLPDYTKMTPFLKKYVEAMGWDKIYIWVMRKEDRQFFAEMQMVG
jgi:predicted HNH restriction endonuclease